MKLFVGLGNPGKKYEKTKHNIGFMVIDSLSKRLNIPLNESKFNGQFGSGLVDGEKVFLLKPLTYMNLSGECVRPFMDYFKISPEDLIVIYDDLDLPVGKIRLRQKGSAGGHNGMKSVISAIGTENFHRLRVGIGRPENRQPVVDYVLSAFAEEDQEVIEDVVEKCSEACEKAIHSPFIEVMNKYNG